MTVHAARAIRHPELGRLVAGGCADIAVFCLLIEPCSFADCGNASMRGDASLSREMTIREDDVVYDPHGRSLPDWENAPEEYWRFPGVIRW